MEYEVFSFGTQVTVYEAFLEGQSPVLQLALYPCQVAVGATTVSPYLNDFVTDFFPSSNVPSPASKVSV